MDAAVASGIFGLLGVILGAILGWVSGWWREWQREVRLRHSVRLLLTLESKQNLDAFFEVWARLTNLQIWVPGVGYLAGVGYSSDEGDFNKRQRFAHEPLPEWRHLMWQSQAGLTATALSPIEINRVYTLHSDLDVLTRRRAELQEALNAPAGRKLAEEYAEWMKLRQRGRAGTGQAARDLEAALHEFNEKTRALWNDCEAIYQRVIPYKDGNLIVESTPIRTWGERLRRKRDTADNWVGQDQ